MLEVLRLALGDRAEAGDPLRAQLTQSPPSIRSQSWPARSTIAVHVLGQHVARGHQRFGGRAHRGQIRRPRAHTARRSRGADRRGARAPLAVRANGSVEPIIAIRSPGAPCSGCRGFQPVNGRQRRTQLDRPDRLPPRCRPRPPPRRRSANSAPILGGSSLSDAARHLGPEVEARNARDPIREAHAGNRAKSAARGLGRDRRAVGEAREDARRRLDALAHPAVEVHQRARAAAARSRPR